MKKPISAVIAICCLAAALTACSAESQDSATPSETTSAVATTAKVESDEDETSASRPSVSAEALASYRKEGTVYRDVDGQMCANLTKDANGYHLAMALADAYKPEEINWFVTFQNFGDSESSFVVSENGTQEESDNITIHGCLDCLRILDVSSDGQRAYDLALYPVNAIPEGVTVNQDLALFDGTLDNYKDKQKLYDEGMPDFLDEAQQKLFASAEYLYLNSIDAQFDCKSDAPMVSNDDFVGKPYGIDFGSFVDYVETVLSAPCAAEFLNDIGIYKNIGGELYCAGGGRGSNLLYTGRSFVLDSKSESEIQFKLIAHNSYQDHIPDEEYHAMAEDKREFDEEYHFTMVKTPNGWRFSEFEYWM